LTSKIQKCLNQPIKSRQADFSYPESSLLDYMLYVIRVKQATKRNKISETLHNLLKKERNGEKSALIFNTSFNVQIS